MMFARLSASGHRNDMKWFIERGFNDSRNNRRPRYLKGKVWEEVPDSERKPPGSSWEIVTEVMDVSSFINNLIYSLFIVPRFE